MTCRQIFCVLPVVFGLIAKVDGVTSTEAAENVVVRLRRSIPFLGLSIAGSGKARFAYLHTAIGRFSP